GGEECPTHSLVKPMGRRYSGTAYSRDSFDPSSRRDTAGGQSSLLLVLVLLLRFHASRTIAGDSDQSRSFISALHHDAKDEPDAFRIILMFGGPWIEWRGFARQKQIIKP